MIDGLLQGTDYSCCSFLLQSEIEEIVIRFFLKWTLSFELSTDSYTFGKLSSNKNRMNRISAKLRRNANIAGYQNHMLADLSDSIENIAPIIGPIMNPTENAMPTKAMALPRFFASDTSVIMAILNDMFPLLSPPTKRASTKIKKFDENAHITYDNEIPTYFSKKNERNDLECISLSRINPIDLPSSEALLVFGHNNPTDRP